MKTFGSVPVRFPFNATFYSFLFKNNFQFSFSYSEMIVGNVIVAAEVESI